MPLYEGCAEIKGLVAQKAESSATAMFPNTLFADVFHLVLISSALYGGRTGA